MSQTSSLVEVRLLDLPVGIWRRASAHQEAIQREFDILRGNLSKDEVPNRLYVLVDELDSRFAATADPTSSELDAAAERGDERIDLTYRVPPEAAAAARQVEEMLSDVDDFCRAGKELMTLATPDDLVDFRRWFLGEFTRQIDQGQDPLSWEDYQSGVRDEPEATGVERPAETDGSHTIVFEGDLDLTTAASLREEILDRRAAGVSDLTLDLTGVQFMDSVGISLLVTAHNRMREEGFSMHLVFPKRLQPLIELSGLMELLDPEFVDPTG